MKNKLHFDFRKLCFVLALILTQCLYAQNKTITGTVTDSTQEPLIGVNVTVDGDTNGSITNMDGLFELRVSKKNAVLKFTYIGFKPSEVRINSSTNNL